MTKIRAAALALCLLLAWTAVCAAAEEEEQDDGGITTGLPAQKMISTPPAPGGVPVWRAEWWKAGVRVAYSLRTDGAPAGEEEYDFYLSDVATGRAYLAAFDGRYGTVECSVVENFMRASECRRIDLGRGELEFEAESLSMPPNHSHSFGGSGLTVGYYLEEGDVVFFVFDVPANRAYFVGYDPKEGTAGGYLVWNLRAAN